MKSDIYTKVKSKKPFEFNDIFVYSGVILLILVLFICFIIIPQRSTPLGIEVCKNDQKVFTFNYSSNTIIIENEFDELIEISDTYNGKLITIYTNTEKTGFNKIYIDLQNKTAKMQDSTCSHSKDCVSLPKISDSGMIFCAPHALKITPIDSKGTPPWTGGANWWSNLLLS